jgi:hypothetical protein
MVRSTRLILLFLLAFAAFTMSSVSRAQVAVGVSIRIGPPALPVYPQPICPGPGYIWTPGYWAYGPAGYYWVPGTWVVAPAIGLLWTPGYWGWAGGVYVWHGGYWGPHVGFYGGINYGFGYTGVGFVGGAWHGGVYSYNTAVTNVNTTVIHNTYNTTVIDNNTTVNRVSYNGGTGGTTAQPTAAEQAAAHEQHTPPTALQTQREHTASTNHALLASANHGQPPVAATAKPGVFTGSGVVAARPASVSANPNRPNAKANAVNHTSTHNDRPPNASTNKGASSPTAAKTYSAQPNQQQHGSSQPQHGSNHQPSNAPHPNEAHPNNSHQNNNRPGTPHPSEGHPTGRLGRGR